MPLHTFSHILDSIATFLYHKCILSLWKVRATLYLFVTCLDKLFYAIAFTEYHLFAFDSLHESVQSISRELKGVNRGIIATQWVYNRPWQIEGGIEKNVNIPEDYGIFIGNVDLMVMLRYGDLMR